MTADDQNQQDNENPDEGLNNKWINMALIFFGIVIAIAVVLYTVTVL